MKKILITIVIIAVVAIAAWLLLRKKDESADGGQGMIGVANPNTSDAEENATTPIEEAIQEERRSEVTSVTDDSGLDYVVAVPDGLTSGEKSDYQNYVDYIKKVTGLNFSGKSYEVVQKEYEEVKEMEKLKETIADELGLTNIRLDDITTNELSELKDYYKANYSQQKKYAEKLAQNFINQFNVDNAFNRKDITTARGKHKYWELKSYKSWDNDTMDGLASLTQTMKKAANDYVKTHWDGNYVIAPKKEKWGTAQADAESRNMNGKSIREALLVSSFMKNGRGAAKADRLITEYALI